MTDRPKATSIPAPKPMPSHNVEVPQRPDSKLSISNIKIIKKNHDTQSGRFLYDVKLTFDDSIPACQYAIKISGKDANEIILDYRQVQKESAAVIHDIISDGRSLFDGLADGQHSFHFEVTNYDTNQTFYSDVAAVDFENQC